MRFYRRIRRSTRQYVIVALICITVIGGAAAFTSIIITGQIKSEYRSLLNKAYHDLKANQKNVYVALKDISPGDIIQASMVEKKKVYTSQPKDIYISQKDIGMTALIEIPAGTQILSTMLTMHGVSDELREIEYQVISINPSIENNDTVDVRLCYPNGECYVVLSKKTVKGYGQDSLSCYFWNDEEEILRMQAAMVDASLYPGSTLFMTKYIEPNIQNASVVNYTPSISILSLIESDPNIIQKASQELSKQLRKALENRLADNLQTDVSTVKWALDPEISLSTTPAPTIGAEANDLISNPVSSEEENNSEEPFPIEEELGSAAPQDDYFYYTKGQKSGGEDIEYGE